MKIRRILIVALLIASVSTPLFARETRLGLGFGLPNAVLVVRPVPWEIKAGYDFTSGNEYVFASLDYRFVNSQPIVDNLHFSLGFGAYTKILVPDDERASFEGGFRLPFGVQYLLFNNFLEFFFQISPGLDFYPKFAFSDQPVQLWAGFTIRSD